MQVWRASCFLAPLACWFAAPACVTDNPAAYEGILGPTLEQGSSGGRETGGKGGTSGASASGTGGTFVEGGMGDGGEAASGTSGTTGGGGNTGGNTAPNPPPHPDFMPPCFLGPTQAGEEILKGTPCTGADPQLCYRPCGPNQAGWKTEECLAGVYAEGDCRFPNDQDYACYRVPELPEMPDKAACKVAAPPIATDPCEAPPCMSCNFDGFYEDTAGDAKEGYCICRDADEMGVRRWTCASTTAWPCPVSRGCF